jgi:hypothetical protein
MARILESYRRTTNQGAGRNALSAYAGGREMARQDKADAAGAEQAGFQRQLDVNKESRAKAKEQREVSESERANRLLKMRDMLGPASTADTQDKWLAAQESGFLPKDLKFEQREPFIMATMTEAERFAREKESTRSSESDRTFGETVRSNKAKEKIYGERARKGKGKSGDRAGGLKASDENFLSKEVANLFDGTYDVATGRIQIKDDRNRRLARRIITRASQLAKGNPEMTLSQAVTQASEENDIQIRDLDKAAAPTMDQDPLGWRQ